MIKNIFSISKIRVRYADTDQMKVVYYGRYFEYFEEARSDLFRSIGKPYTEIEKEGIALPVVEAKANYKAPSFYDDLLEVKVILKDVTDTSVRFEYEIRKNNLPEIVTTGFTVHVFYDINLKKVARSPKNILKILKD